MRGSSVLDVTVRAFWRHLFCLDNLNLLYCVNIYYNVRESQKTHKKLLLLAHLSQKNKKKKIYKWSVEEVQQMNVEEIRNLL